MIEDPPAISHADTGKRPVDAHPAAALGAHVVVQVDVVLTVDPEDGRTQLDHGAVGEREHQAALEQERTLFVSAVAHDLRTPLFALRSYLEGLETEDEPCVTVSATCPAG